MKRYRSALALALVLLLTLSGCGGSLPGRRPSVTATPSPTATPEPTLAPTATPEPSREEMLGHVKEELLYVNDFAGLAFQPEGNWRYLSEADMAELTAMVTGAVDDAIADELRREADSGDTVLCMYATCDDGLPSMSLSVERLYGEDAALTGEEYLAAGTPQLEEALASLGVAGVTSRMGTVSIAGAEAACVRLQGQLNGGLFCETAAALRQQEYVLVFTCAAGSSAEADALLECWFTPEQAP